VVRRARRCFFPGLDPLFRSRLEYSAAFLARTELLLVHSPHLPRMIQDEYFCMCLLCLISRKNHAQLLFHTISFDFAQERVGFQTSIDAVQKQTCSTNNVTGAKRSHEGIPRDCVPNDYNGEPVQLMSRDAPPLLPSLGLKARSSTCAMLPGLDVHNELSKYLQRRIAASTLGLDQNPLLS
jgi:hypothetical protein